MSANYKQLSDFTKKIEKLNNQQKEEFLEACCRELAARLLAKVIKRTPKNKDEDIVGGTLQRGWTTSSTGDAKRDTKQAMYENMFGGQQRVSSKGMEIKHVGNKYIIDIVNPVEYASYVEYGHRTRKKDGYGWAEGHHMLTISETELNSMSDAILQKKLNKFMKDVFK